MRERSQAVLLRRDVKAELTVPFCLRGHEVKPRSLIAKEPAIDLVERLARLEDENARLLSHLWLLSGRLADVEQRLGVQAPPREADLVTVKQFASKVGYSESNVRKLIRLGKLAHRWIGGRVFVLKSEI